MFFLQPTRATVAADPSLRNIIEIYTSIIAAYPEVLVRGAIVRSDLSLIYVLDLSQVRLPKSEEEAAYDAAEEYFTHSMLMFRASTGHLLTFNRECAFQYFTQVATRDPLRP